MNDIYLTIADGFDKLAAGYRALASGTAAAPTSEPAVQEKAPEPPKPTIAIEDVRAVLAAKSKAGKRAEVKNLLLKYDSGTLSGVKPEDYAALLAEVEAL